MSHFLCTQCGTTFYSTSASLIDGKDVCPTCFANTHHDDGAIDESFLDPPPPDLAPYYGAGKEP